MSTLTPNNTTTPAPRHQIYVPGYAMAKLGLTCVGLTLLAASLYELIPLGKLAFFGGSTRAEAVRMVLTDNSGQGRGLTSDAEVQSAMKVLEETRDRVSAFWLEYRINVDGKIVEVRAPLGQHVKPLQMLRDNDGLPSTTPIWYDRANPSHIALPMQIGTWFMPGMLVLFGSLGTFMGCILFLNAKKPIEMPDLSRSHGEQDTGKAKT